jgi:uncharacterized protein (UPF0332 family)
VGTHADFAASRAYYGCFYTAEALLLSEGLSYSRHSLRPRVLKKKRAVTWLTQALGKASRAPSGSRRWEANFTNVGDTQDSEFHRVGMFFPRALPLCYPTLSPSSGYPALSQSSKPPP